MSSRGFTLTELLVAMVVMGLLGTVLARVLITNSRLVGRQDAMAEAREAARAAMSVMSAELHGVGDSGLVAASRDRVSMRVPYAFGMICRTTSGTTVASLMPSDSVTYAAAVPGGLAWRNAAGFYVNITGFMVTSSTNSSACTADSIRVVPGGRLVGIVGIQGSQVPDSGSVFYLYQLVTYSFWPSSDLPGRRGLWRKAGSAAWEELAAPFDTAARFAFLMGPHMTVDTRWGFPFPAALDSVRGLELRLTGASVAVPPGSSRAQTFDLRTNVRFQNKIFINNELVY